MAVTIRHFANQPESLDTYTGGDLSVERDDTIIRIDAAVGDDDHPLGRPGVSIEMDEDAAEILAVRMLRAINPSWRAKDGGDREFPCGMGAACWFTAVPAGFFEVQPTVGRHETLRDAFDCIRAAEARSRR